MLLLKVIFRGKDMEHETVLQSGFDYEGMISLLDKLCRSYGYLEVGTLGHTFMDRNIPLVSIGKGKSSLVYVGAVYGREYMTSIALLRFIKEYCEAYSRGGKMYGNSIEALFCEQTLYIIPMLDVDGAEYSINGIADKDILYDKLCEGKSDFECERGALSNFVRFGVSPNAVLTLRQQREGIVFSGISKSFVRAMSIAKCLSKITGYPIDASNEETDFFLHEIDVPYVSLKCGDGRGKSGKDLPFYVYSNVREILFRTPFMI